MAGVQASSTLVTTSGAGAAFCTCRNKALVVANRSNRAGEKNVKPGDELLAINGRPVQDCIGENVSSFLHFSTPQDGTERICRYNLFAAKAGEVWTFTLKGPGGKTETQGFVFEKAGPAQPLLPMLSFSVLPGNVVLRAAQFVRFGKNRAAVRQHLPGVVQNRRPHSRRAGQPVFLPLPGGGVGAVCSKRGFFADGTEAVGTGIQPNLLVRPTAKSTAAVGGCPPVPEK